MKWWLRRFLQLTPQMELISLMENSGIKAIYKLLYYEVSGITVPDNAVFLQQNTRLMRSISVQGSLHSSKPFRFSSVRLENRSKSFVLLEQHECFVTKQRNVCKNWRSSPCGGSEQELCGLGEGEADLTRQIQRVVCLDAVGDSLLIHLPAG